VSDPESLSDTELVDLLQRYLTILQGHPSAEEMMLDFSCVAGRRRRR
jgi:hypothetical protein